MTLAEGNNRLQTVKYRFIERLQVFAGDFAKPDAQRQGLDIHAEFGRLVSMHTEFLGELGTVIYEVHRKADLYEDALTRDDIVSSARSFVDTSFQFWQMYRDLSAKGLPAITIAPGAYDQVQKLFNSFLSDHDRDHFRTQLSAYGITLLAMDDKLPRPINVKARVRTSVGVGAGSITVVFAIFLTNESIPSQFAMMLQALFALGLGGLSAALIGGATVRLQAGPIGGAIGGIAVMLIVWFYPPVVPFDSFQIFISLRDEAGNVVPTSDRLFLDFDGPDDPEGSSTRTGGEYTFNNVSSKHLNDTVDTYLQIPAQLAFNATETNRIRVRLKLGETCLKVIRNPEVVLRESADSMFMITGRVLDQRGNPLKGAKIVAGNNEADTLSDRNGNFKLLVRKKLHNDSLARIVISIGGITRFDDFFQVPSPVVQDVKLLAR
jgi:hypothetical protein